MTTHYTRGSVSTLHGVGGVLGTAFGHYFFGGAGGSHNFMVMTLGLCVNPKGELPCRQLAH